LEYLRRFLEEDLASDSRQIRQAWNTPRFQRAAWTYLVSKLPKVRGPEKAGLVSYPRITPTIRIKHLEKIQKCADDLYEAICTADKVTRRMCLISEPIYAMLETLSREAEQAVIETRLEKEAPDGVRKNAGKRDHALEHLLLDVARCFHPIVGLGTKRLTLECARTIHSWATGRLRTINGSNVWVRPVRPGEDWGDNPWERVQLELHFYYALDAAGIGED